MRDTIWLFAFALIGISLFLLTGTNGVMNTLGVTVQNGIQQAAWSGQTTLNNMTSSGSSTASAQTSVDQSAMTALVADLAPISGSLLPDPTNTTNGQPVQINGVTVAYETTSIQNNVVTVEVVGNLSVPWFATFASGTFNGQSSFSSSGFDITALGTTP